MTTKEKQSAGYPRRQIERAGRAGRGLARDVETIGKVCASACVQIGTTVVCDVLDGFWRAQAHVAGHIDAQNPVRIEGGQIRRPTGPGLGAGSDDSRFGAPLLSI